jgi:hypothetical protein
LHARGHRTAKGSIRLLLLRVGLAIVLSTRATLGCGAANHASRCTSSSIVAGNGSCGGAGGGTPCPPASVL